MSLSSKALAKVSLFIHIFSHWLLKISNAAIGTYIPTIENGCGKFIKKRKISAVYSFITNKIGNFA